MKTMNSKIVYTSNFFKKISQNDKFDEGGIAK